MEGMKPNIAKHRRTKSGNITSLKKRQIEALSLRDVRVLHAQDWARRPTEHMHLAGPPNLATTHHATTITRAALSRYLEAPLSNEDLAPAQPKAAAPDPGRSCLPMFT